MIGDSSWFLGALGTGGTHVIDGPVWFFSALGIGGMLLVYLRGWRRERREQLRRWRAYDEVAQARHDEFMRALTWSQTSREARQLMISAWTTQAFGEASATSLPQRGLRLLEEAIELFQACGGEQAFVRRVAAHVFARPKGTIAQELGGVAVCLLALAQAADLSADEEEWREIRRVLGGPLHEFTRRDADKSAQGLDLSVRSPEVREP